MPYMDPFESIVTTTKRNHRYYGPTESHKVDGSVTEIATDLSTVFTEVTDISTSIDALASGYLEPSGVEDNLWDLRREVNRFNSKMKNRIYLQTNLQ